MNNVVEQDVIERTLERESAVLSIKNDTKINEGRGKGSGASYLPWIQTREISSVGTCSNPKDWKTGRTVELLSQGEAYYWHILRWNDEIEDIREQYPLDLETTLEICDDYNVKHPRNRHTYMTSDFYVTYKDGKEKVFSVKPSRNVLKKSVPRKSSLSKRSTGKNSDMYRLKSSTRMK